MTEIKILAMENLQCKETHSTWTNLMIPATGTSILPARFVLLHMPLAEYTA